MEVFILLHSDAYESSDGQIIACSLFRENLIERMNNMAASENHKILELAHHRDARVTRFYVYDEQDNSWVKWNGRKWMEKLSIQSFDMM